MISNLRFYKVSINADKNLNSLVQQKTHEWLV